MNLSVRGRLKIWLIAGVVLAVLIGLAAARISRLTSLVGQGNGYERVSALLVRRFGIPAEALHPGTTMDELSKFGVDQNDFADALRDELRLTLTEEDAARINTVADAARAAERRNRD